MCCQGFLRLLCRFNATPVRVSTFFLVELYKFILKFIWGFPGSSALKEAACSAGDPSLIPGLGRSPGEGKDYPLQYSGLENSMDRIVHGKFI